MEQVGMPAAPVVTGDMFAATYDPGTVAGDAFDLTNHIGTVNSAQITNDTIADVDINSGAAIAGSKIFPDFGAQAITTMGSLNIDGSTTFNGNTIIGDGPLDRVTVTAEIMGDLPFNFEGLTGDNIYTTLAITDPTVARTITFPDASGTVVLDNNGASALTAAEVDQLENIDATLISTIQWGYLGAMDQALATTDNVTFNQLTMTGVLDMGTNGISNVGPLAVTSI